MNEHRPEEWASGYGTWDFIVLMCGGSADKMTQCSISASTDISRCGCTAVEKWCGSKGTACVVLPAGL